jgi:hypothetical protein
MDDDQVILQSRDGHDFKVEYKVIKQSETLKSLIEDAGIDHPIPVPNITGKTLAKIIEYLKLIHEGKDIDLKETLTEPELLAFTLAANFLDIPILFNAALDECVRYIFTAFGTSSKFSEQFKTEFLNRFPKDLQREIIQRGDTYLIPPHMVKPLATFHAGGQVRIVAFNLDGTQIGTASAPGEVRLWEIKPDQNPRPAPEFRSLVFAPENHIVSLTFSPSGNKIVIAFKNGTILLEAKQPEQMYQTIGAAELLPKFPPEMGINRFYSIMFIPGSTLIATQSEDGMIGLWDQKTNQNPKLISQFRANDEHLRTINCIAFSRDGTHIATASSHGTKLWKYELGLPPHLVATFPDESMVLSVAFSLDGTQIATASADNMVKVWKAKPSKNPRPLLTLRHSGPATAVAFSPDGKRIATASGYGMVTLWELPNIHEYLNKLDLINAQIIAYVIKNNIKRLTDLPDYLQNNLSDYVKEILFPPMMEETESASPAGSRLKMRRSNE